MGEFIGVKKLRSKHAEQLSLFREWAEQGSWASFHANHYDWWAFPIRRPSNYGRTYTLTEDAVSILEADAEFIANLRECASLLLLSWGWDLLGAHEIEDPAPGQNWANWPIRLWKCYESLRIFGQQDACESIWRFAKILHSRGHSFEYSGRDLLEEIAQSNAGNMPR